MKIITKETIPDGPYKTYRKIALTRAIRMDGPFRVDTREGPLTCQDGYLCIDARGYPYPCDKEEFETIYVEADLEIE